MQVHTQPSRLNHSLKSGVSLISGQNRVSRVFLLFTARTIISSGLFPFFSAARMDHTIQVAGNVLCHVMGEASYDPSQSIKSSFSRARRHLQWTLGIKYVKVTNVTLKFLLVENDMYENHYKGSSDSYKKVWNRTWFITAKRCIIKFLRAADARGGTFRTSKDLLGCQEAGGMGDLKRWKSKSMRAQKLYKN